MMKLLGHVLIWLGAPLLCLGLLFQIPGVLLCHAGQNLKEK
jgi:hypothetical protein